MFTIAWNRFFIPRAGKCCKYPQGKDEFVMSNAKLIYDPEHMDEICSKYKQCAEYADQAINNLERLKANFFGNYQGQASEMAEDLYNKIKEHTELLRDCLFKWIVLLHIPKRL